jgi:hypothetical protein
MVRALQLATILALMKRINGERVMAAAHPTAGRRGFSFRDSHFGTCSCKTCVAVKKAAETKWAGGSRRRAYTASGASCKP